MTEKLIDEVISEARERWDLGGVIVIHRVGSLLPKDQIVLVAVTSSHRESAYLANQYIMDYLKVRATFWKMTDIGGQRLWLDMKDSDKEQASGWCCS